LFDPVTLAFPAMATAPGQTPDSSQISRRAIIPATTSTRRSATTGAARSAAIPRGSPAATRERLLEAAEACFVQSGYDGASLRVVTAAAGVNVAAANYHFGGKEGLFRAMLAERLDGMNAARVATLDAAEAAAGGAPLGCERILAAMIVPALRQARDDRTRGRDFLRLLGRAYVDPSAEVRAFLSERYAAMIERFKDAFGRALPELPRAELSWRLHFTLGALSYTLAGTDAWRLMERITPGSTADDALLLNRLAPFLVAGLQAPVPQLHGDELVVPSFEVAPRGPRRTA
jgi:AcrR family transcriptional regulator